MVVYFGMSKKLPNVCYYDSTGQSYGFTKPYSEERAKVIDDEVSRIISEQYERAKQLLSTHADGHGQLTEMLLSREVIYTDDVEHIFGKRPWVSRTDEILKINEEIEEKRKKEEEAEARKSAEESNNANTENGNTSTTAGADTPQTPEPQSENDNKTLTPPPFSK